MINVVTVIVTSSQCLFCPTNNPILKIVKNITKLLKGNPHILKLEPLFFCHSTNWLILICSYMLLGNLIYNWTLHFISMSYVLYAKIFIYKVTTAVRMKLDRRNWTHTSQNDGGDRNKEVCGETSLSCGSADGWRELMTCLCLLSDSCFHLHRCSASHCTVLPQINIAQIWFHPAWHAVNLQNYHCCTV